MIAEMNQFSEHDAIFMKRALALAEKGQYTVSPNPRVGCVIVKNGSIIGEGFHQKAGEPHAEVYALNEAGSDAVDSTVYVTLEPCSHYGRTPPCANALVKANVKKVIIATTDPNPQVAGKGIKLLQKAGIEVELGLLKAEADWLNRFFFTRITTGRPYVQLKLGISLDGKVAMASGESKWITSSESRQDVQLHRAETDMILSTSRTVVLDNANLNVRMNELPSSSELALNKQSIKQPIRLILDRSQSLTGKETLFSLSGDIWLVRASPIASLSNITYLPSNTLDPRNYLPSLLDYVGSKQINSLWVEAGATLAGELLQQNLVDELVLYYAPKLLGSTAIGMCNMPLIETLNQAPEFKVHSIKQIGPDFKVVLTRK